MSQFDVCRLRTGGALVLDCQSEILDELNTRFVVPLILKRTGPAAAHRLNPVFLIDGENHVMVTQFAASIERRELGEVVLSLSDRAVEIIGALHVLTRGV